MANLLEKRKKEVRVITRDSDTVLSLTAGEIAQGTIIEEKLIKSLVTFHDNHCK